MLVVVAQLEFGGGKSVDNHNVNAFGEPKLRNVKLRYESVRLKLMREKLYF